MIVEIDKKGRILLPKNIRKALNISEKSRFRVILKEDKIILIPEKSIAHKYAGKYKAKKEIPEDLDNFLNKVIMNWWKEST